MREVIRSYDDPCGIARALDLIGERWALLVVRELLLGPKRFSQLRRGLRGASPNVLSQRLRELEAAGLVRRGRLAPPADVAVYELTERGQDLEPILLQLGRWGSSVPMTTTASLGVDALLVALKSMFAPARVGDLRAGFELRLNGERFRVDIADGGMDIMRGAAESAAAVIETDGETLRGVVFGGEPLLRLTIRGDRRAATRLLRGFDRPTKR